MCRHRAAVHENIFEDNSNIHVSKKNAYIYSEQIGTMSEEMSQQYRVVKSIYHRNIVEQKSCNTMSKTHTRFDLQQPMPYD